VFFGQDDGRLAERVAEVLVEANPMISGEKEHILGNA